MGDEPPSKFKRICVFCGSNSGNRSVFSDAALNLGHELVRRRINLVYGGGSVGLMGLISQTVRDGGCHVLGVIPKALVPVEISGESIGEVKIVSDMHERKGVMAQQADAFIALPGGYGTMEEVMEMITWSQLGIHDKPIGLLNVDGYYNSLLELFDNGVQEGFIKPACRHIVISASTANELLAKMELYTPLHREIAPRESWEIAHLGQEMVPSGQSCTVNQSGPLPKRTALLAMMCQGLIDLVLLKKENPEKQRTEIIGSGEMAVSSIGARKIFR